MVEEDLGMATIVYEAPDDSTVEETLENEHVAYFQDHWILKTGEDDQGRDTVRRIPHQRVYHVERTVEEFEEEISTLRTQLRSVAEDLQENLQQKIGGSERQERETHQIEITSESAETDNK